MSTTTVYVVSFEPDPEHGGVGGFNWFRDLPAAEQRFDTGSSEDTDRGVTWALWEHETEHVDDPVKVTEEIDSLWVEGWPVPGVRVHRTLVTGDLAVVRDMPDPRDDALDLIAEYVRIIAAIIRQTGREV